MLISDTIVSKKEATRDADADFAETAPVRFGARERRVVEANKATRQRLYEHYPNAVAFAYSQGWTLEKRITITWDACKGGERDEGHILGLPDQERNELLRREMARILRKAGHHFACVWSRDRGGKLGLHIHLALYWPLGDEVLFRLLERLTGSPRQKRKLRPGIIAQSECGGWQVKQNTARRTSTGMLKSAYTWMNYLRGQMERHEKKPDIDGRVLGVSRIIDKNAVEAQRGTLEAWKAITGWNDVAEATTSCRRRLRDGMRHIPARQSYTCSAAGEASSIVRIV